MGIVGNEPKTPFALVTEGLEFRYEIADAVLNVSGDTTIATLPTFVTAPGQGDRQPRRRCMDTTSSPLAFAAGEESRVDRSAEFSGAPIPLPSLIAVPNDTDNPEALKFDWIIGYSKHGCSYGYTGFCGVPE